MWANGVSANSWAQRMNDGAHVPRYDSLAVAVSLEDPGPPR